MKQSTTNPTAGWTETWVAQVNRLAAEMDANAAGLHPSAWAEALAPDRERFRKLASKQPAGAVATTLPIDFDQGAWLTFTADHNRDEAGAAFETRFGRPPAHVALDTRFRVPTLKVGPVPEENLL